MAMGRREEERQRDLFVMAANMPKSPGHAFYRKLNELLAEAGFDRFAESLCEPFYAAVRGRPSIPPGVYFRMLLVGYFEGIGSQRGIAWRCSDSLSLREFLGLAVTDDSPDHSSLSRVRDRLPAEAHHEVFGWILRLAASKKLLSGKTLGIDSTTLEANAAMKTIVRRESGEDWKEYLTRLMRDEGAIGPDETPSDDDLRRFDKKRTDKKVSNDDWESPVDPDARIARMKDGTTHLAYKAENAVDLKTNIIVSAEIYHANQADPHTLEDSIHAAQTNLTEAQPGSEVVDVVVDAGYHSAETLATIAEHTTYRMYAVEPRRSRDNRWTNKPVAHKKAVYANRRRTRGKRGRALQRLRSEYVERTFAHVCETGGARRTWLRTIEKVRKRFSIAAAAHNLCVMMRSLFEMGTPRGLQRGLAAIWAALIASLLAWLATTAKIARGDHPNQKPSPPRKFPALRAKVHAREKNWTCSTGC
jgi:transposase